MTIKQKNFESKYDEGYHNNENLYQPKSLHGVEKVGEKKVQPKKRNKFFTTGNDVYKYMILEQKKILCSKSDTLHLKYCLGLDRWKSNRKFTDGQVKPWPTVIGVKLVSDEDIEVPVIRGKLYYDLKEKNIKEALSELKIYSRTISRGEEFNLNMYEFFFLMIKTEYGGFLSSDGYQAYMSFKQPKEPEKLILPTPFIRIEKYKGSSRENILSIDARGADGKWYIIKDYAEEFRFILNEDKKNKYICNSKIWEIEEEFEGRNVDENILYNRIDRIEAPTISILGLKREYSLGTIACDDKYDEIRIKIKKHLDDKLIPMMNKQLEKEVKSFLKEQDIETGLINEIKREFIRNFIESFRKN